MSRSTGTFLLHRPDDRRQPRRPDRHRGRRRSARSRCPTAPPPTRPTDGAPCPPTRPQSPTGTSRPRRDCGCRVCGRAVTGGMGAAPGLLLLSDGGRPAPAAARSRWWRSPSTGWGTPPTVGCACLQGRSRWPRPGTGAVAELVAELARMVRRPPGRRVGRVGAGVDGGDDRPVLVPPGRGPGRAPGRRGARAWPAPPAPAGPGPAQRRAPAGRTGRVRRRTSGCRPGRPGRIWPVLVFDDTTTTGAAAQSAAAALRLAGAHVVGALVMGRALARSRPPPSGRAVAARPTVAGC